MSIRRIAGCLLLLSASGWAVPPAQFAYDEDQVPVPDFNANGAWVVQGIAGSAQITHLTKRQSRKMLGTTLQIDGKKASLWNKKVMQWQVFQTPVINEETYNTQSKEFWFDFATDPGALNLPKFVTVVDVELGDLVYAGPQRVLLLYEGTWYNVARGTG